MVAETLDLNYLGVFGIWNHHLGMNPTTPFFVLAD